jgi:hypothetical protein
MCDRLIHEDVLTLEALRKGLVRVKDGVWQCCAPVLITWSNGESLELRPGTVYVLGARYQGVDVAALLDDLLAGCLPESVSIRFPDNTI